MKNKTSIKKTKTIKNKLILLIMHRTNERSRDCLLFCMYLYYRKNIKKINIQTFEPQKTTNKTNILINFFSNMQHIRKHANSHRPSVI